MTKVIETDFTSSFELFLDRQKQAANAERMEVVISFLGSVLIPAVGLYLWVVA